MLRDLAAAVNECVNAVSHTHTLGEKMRRQPQPPDMALFEFQLEPPLASMQSHWLLSLAVEFTESDEMFKGKQDVFLLLPNDYGWEGSTLFNVTLTCVSIQKKKY